MFFAYTAHALPVPVPVTTITFDGAQTQGGVSGAQTQGGTNGAQTQGGTTGAQTQGGPGAFTVNSTLQNPLGETKTFNDLVAKVLRALVTVMMPFVVLGFIWTGFMFVYAQGNPDMLKKAKVSLQYTIVGAFILLGAWGFAQIIGTTVAGITGA